MQKEMQKERDKGKEMEKERERERERDLLMYVSWLFEIFAHPSVQIIRVTFCQTFDVGRAN